MCLSTAYKLEGNDRVLLGNYIAAVRVDHEDIILTTLMGEEITLTGKLKNVDLVKNEILIDAKS